VEESACFGQLPWCFDRCGDYDIYRTVRLALTVCDRCRARARPSMRRHVLRHSGVPRRTLPLQLEAAARSSPRSMTRDESHSRARSRCSRHSTATARPWSPAAPRTLRSSGIRRRWRLVSVPRPSWRTIVLLSVNLSSRSAGRHGPGGSGNSQAHSVALGPDAARECYRFDISAAQSFFRITCSLNKNDFEVFYANPKADAPSA
jgi:hypothetical protein